MSCNVVLECILKCLYFVVKASGLMRHLLSIDCILLSDVITTISPVA